MYGYADRRSREAGSAGVPPPALPEAVLRRAAGKAGGGAGAGYGRRAQVPRAMASHADAPAVDQRRKLVPLLHAAALDATGRTVTQTTVELGQLLAAAAEALGAETERADAAEAEAEASRVAADLAVEKHTASEAGLIDANRELNSLQAALRNARRARRRPGDESPPPLEHEDSYEEEQGEDGAELDFATHLQLGLALDEVANKERELTLASNEAATLRLQLEAAQAALARSRENAEELRSVAEANVGAQRELDNAQLLLADQALATLDGVVASLPKLAAAGVARTPATAQTPATPALPAGPAQAQSPGLGVIEAMASRATTTPPTGSDHELANMVERACTNVLNVLRDAKRLTWMQPLLLPAHLLLGALGDALSAESASGGDAPVRAAVGDAVRARVRSTIPAPL